MCIKRKLIMVNNARNQEKIKFNPILKILHFIHLYTYLGRKDNKIFIKFIDINLCFLTC